MGRVAPLAAAALLLALTVTACGERGEPTGTNTTRLYPVTIASPTGGKALVVRAPVKRIAVLDARSMQPILAALGAGRQIVTTPVARNGDLQTSELVSHRPDLLVATTSADDDQLVKQAARLVPKALVYRAPVDSIQGVETAMTQLGLITGNPGNATRLVRDIETTQARIHARLARTPPVTVFLDTGSGLNATDQSLAGDMLREAHASNVAGNVDQIDPAELVRLDPDWYLATSDSGTTLAKLRKDPRKRKLRAVRLGRFEIVQLVQISPGPAIGAGLLALAKTLHPDAIH